jgi:transposase
MINMKDEPLENTVVYMHSMGLSIRHISCELGIGRQRAKRIIKANTRQRLQGTPEVKAPVSKRSSKLDLFKEYILELVQAYPNPPITNQRIYELLTEKGYRGKITILRDYLSLIRGKKEKEPVYCVETPAGQQASHDWSDYMVPFTGRGGYQEKVTMLSYILHYSRRQYIEVVDDKTQTTLFRCLVSAFIYFDGVPREIRSDNQKACVDCREYGRVVFNKAYLLFATHYRFRPLAINPGKPRENLKVERPFYYLETNFLNGRRFYDKDDLRRQLSQWLLEHNDLRKHATTGRRPIDMFLEELPCLQALPKEHYDTSDIGYRVVNNESAIQWKNYFYIVPSSYMHQTCTVRDQGQEITIYGPNGQAVKTYPLAEPGRENRYIGRTERPAGETSIRIQDVRQRLATLGPVMQQYMELLKTGKPATYRHHWRHLLSLKALYRPEDILVAVERALNYRVFEAQAIENFLKINAPKKKGE